MSKNKNLDVDVDEESLGLAGAVADVEAEDVLVDVGLLHVLHIEDVVCVQVLHGEGHLRADDLSTTGRTHWGGQRDTWI